MGLGVGRLYAWHTKIWRRAQSSHRGHRDHRAWGAGFSSSVDSVCSVAQSSSWGATHIGRGKAIMRKTRQTSGRERLGAADSVAASSTWLLKLRPVDELLVELRVLGREVHRMAVDE